VSSSSERDLSPRFINAHLTPVSDK
jgi:hypothetical protein